MENPICKHENVSFSLNFLFKFLNFFSQLFWLLMKIVFLNMIRTNFWGFYWENLLCLQFQLNGIEKGCIMTGIYGCTTTFFCIQIHTYDIGLNCADSACLQWRKKEYCASDDDVYAVSCVCACVFVYKAWNIVVWTGKILNIVVFACILNVRVFSSFMWSNAFYDGKFRGWLCE